MQHPQGKRLRRFLLIAVTAALAAPGAAQAHRLTTVAVDYRVRASAPVVAGIGVRIRDGGRKLELTAPPGRRLEVLGYAGEPFLRFTTSGVDARGASPTAEAAGLGGNGAGWARITSSHRLAWTDTRLIPGGSLRTRWSVPVLLDEHRLEITGVSWREPRPVVWPWLLLGGGVLGAALLGRRSSRGAGLVAAGLAGTATTVSLVGLALEDAGSSVSRWLQVGAVGAIVAGGIAVALRWPRAAVAALGAVAVVAVLEGIAQLGVFRHAVVLSALPGPAARVAVCVGLAAGLGAAILSFLEPQGTRA